MKGQSLKYQNCLPEEKLRKLMTECEADLIKMRGTLKGQGIKVTIGMISWWINKNPNLKNLAENLRKNRAEKSLYHGNRVWLKKLTADPRVEKIMVLGAKNTTAEAIAHEIRLLPRVVEGYLRSILIETGTKTIEDARKKWQKGEFRI